MSIILIMKALGDETRLRILNLLNHGELCVCELESILDINQSNASRHLNKLLTAGLIIYEKRSLFVYYKLNDKILSDYIFLNELITKELIQIDKCSLDLVSLKKYKNSGLTCEDLREGHVCLKSLKED